MKNPHEGHRHFGVYVDTRDAVDIKVAAALRDQGVPGLLRDLLEKHLGRELLPLNPKR